MCSRAWPAATTLAPSRAKASAVARPIPVPPPVTKATLPKALLSSVISSVLADSGPRLPGWSPTAPDRSGSHHDLERLALVHRAVAVWNSVEADGAVEHAAGLDAALQH